MDTGLLEDEYVAIVRYLHFGMFWKEGCGDKTFHSGYFCLGKLYGSGAQQQSLNHKLENGHNQRLSRC